MTLETLILSVLIPAVVGLIGFVWRKVYFNSQQTRFCALVLEVIQ
jgi:hypothetical protein